MGLRRSAPRPALKGSGGGAASLLVRLLLLGAAARPGWALQNVTAPLFGAEAYGTLAAFGDFNSDKQTDLFVLRGGGSDLIIFLADQKEPYFKPKVKLTLKNQSLVITSVVPGDYNGDSQMDVLLTTRPKNRPTDDLSVFIFWGNNQTLDSQQKFLLNKKFHDEPLIMDFNGDLIPDVFGVTTESDKPQILIGRVKGKDGNFSTAKYTKKKPEGVMMVGQSVFADFDGDGQTELLLPACMDKDCHKSVIYLSKPSLDHWFPVLQDFTSKGTLWGFVPYTGDSTSTKFSVPITLHIGDYNMDGYPDALAILKNTSGSNQQAFLLENVPCNNASCKSVRRMFKVYWDLSDLNQIKEAVVATFFDIYEDGILDIIVLSRDDIKQELAIHALKNNFEADAYFVKVIVLSGLCSNDCPNKTTPFGVNQPGPYIMYTTVDANGNTKNGSGKTYFCQLLSTSLFHVSSLSVHEKARMDSHHPKLPAYSHSLSSLPASKFLCNILSAVPQARVVTFSWLLLVPHSWSAKLYLTPSNIVLLTAIALIGVCVFILAIIGILHWQEKKADDREKRQEAHRFHFDAM
ncbi:hypothetical protein lerEdw1_000858 [Lerista edwardsae]|nr:hypothetical protein lerEdw1_000858 [Lerista edwardsae]